MPERLADIAKLIDHSLLHPTMTDDEIRRGCETARRWGCASVCVKPYAVAMAAAILRGSKVAVGAVVGFPHGNSTVEVKLAEAERALDDGATELDAVVNVGKVLSGDWEYIEREVSALVAVAHRRGALLKVIFENDFLADDATKVRLCRIASATGVDFVKTSTGYGFVKQKDGGYGYRGATDHDLALMRRECPPEVQVKAAGGVRTLDDVLRVRALGATRIGASATEAILDEARRRGYV